MSEIDEQEWMMELAEGNLGGQAMESFAKRLLSFAIETNWSSMQLECLGLDGEHGCPNARLSFLIDGSREEFNGGKLSFEVGARLAQALCKIGSYDEHGPQEVFDAESPIDCEGMMVSLPSGRGARLKFRSLPVDPFGALITVRPSSLDVRQHPRLLAEWEAFEIERATELASEPSQTPRAGLRI